MFYNQLRGLVYELKKERYIEIRGNLREFAQNNYCRGLYY